MKWPELWKRHAFLFLSIALVILVFLVSVGIAKAAGSVATVTWVHPVVYVDGSPLALADIKETIVTWRRPGSTTVTGSVHVAGPATSTTVNGLQCGNFEFTAATVVQTVSSVETAPTLYATGVTCTPNPPTGLKVT
jgi:hypothetical protein